MYDHLLIPVDGSDESKRAAMHGLNLARVSGATVDVLHVVEKKALQLTNTADEKRRLLERGETILEEIDEIASKRDCPITTNLIEGRPAVRIPEYAVDRNATAIVIGRQGTTGLRKRLLGGVTKQVIYRSDVPVLVVPYRDSPALEEPAYSRVLIPTDGSQTAELAAQHGAAIASQYEAAIHVLNIVDLQTAGGPFNAGGLEKEFVDRLEARGKEAVNAVATKINGSAPNADVTLAVERTASFEGIAAGIRKYARKHDIDLIVIGSHGRSNLKRQLLGSATTALLRTCDVPVLVVKRSG